MSNLESKPKNDFSKGSIPRNILSMALPMTMAQLVNVLYSVVDRIYLGHLPGTKSLALTGIGLTVPILSLIVAFAQLCGSGGGPLCSIERGKKSYDQAERIMGTSFVLLLVFGLTVSSLFFAFRRPFLYLFGASETTYPYAHSYLTIYLIGSPFVMISLGMNFFINAQGFGKTGMWTVVIGTVLNVLLDPLFIFFLDMGVEGAALATVISQAVSAGWVLLFLTGKRAILKLKWSYLKLDRPIARKVLTLGLSGFFVYFTNSIVQTVCNKMTQVWGGDTYVGVMTIINSVREIIFMVVHGFSNAFQPVSGYNYGAGLYSRVRESIDFAVKIEIGFCLFATAVIMLVPQALFHIFTPDAEIITAGIPCIRIYFSCFVFLSLQVLSQAIFTSLNLPKYGIFFSIMRKVVINAPLTLILPCFMGVNGVFVAEAASQLVIGIASFWVMSYVVYRPLKGTPDFALSPLEKR